MRSVAVSPRRGPIALAVVRREIEPGTVVRARDSGQQVEAQVVALPFDGPGK